MSRTIRWWQKKKDIPWIARKLDWCDNTWMSYANPFWSRHESKLIRKQIEKRHRLDNKMRLNKGLDVEPQKKTNGWETW